MADEVVPARGQQWRRERSGRVVVITDVIQCGSSRDPYLDIRWETVDKPRRRGACYETPWYRNYSLVEES